MTHTQIEKLLIEGINKIQILSGREIVSLNAQSSPLLDTPGFDSLNGVEVTVDVIDQLGLQIDFNNVFVDDSKPLTISQAAARLQKTLSKVPA